MSMKNWAIRLAATTALVLAALPAAAQDLPKVKLGMSGWTGFSPLTLAEKAGLFKKHGVDVETVFIPQKERLAALASGSVHAVATTVDTQILWATTVPLTQVLVMDHSNGADGIAARPGINSIADLKGKTIAVDGPGTSPYFVMAYILMRNGIALNEVKTVTLAPQPAATAFVAGQYDAASSYEPYLSQVREMKENGKILVTTADYPIIVDTVAFQPDYIAKNKAAVQGVVNGFFDAVQMIKTDQDKAYAIMGERVKQTPEAFANSAKYLRWLDKKENQTYFATKMDEFMRYAAKVQMEAGVIKKDPDFKQLMDASFVK